MKSASFLAGISAGTLVLASLVLAQTTPAPAPAPAPAAARGGGGGFGGATATPGLGAPMIDLYQAGVVGSRARGGTSLFNDLETTAMTRFDEKMDKEIIAVVRARAELARVPFSAPAEIAAKAQSLADAEMALALRRAAEFPALKRELNLTPERMRNFLTQLR